MELTEDIVKVLNDTAASKTAIAKTDSDSNLLLLQQEKYQEQQAQEQYVEEEGKFNAYVANPLVAGVKDTLAFNLGSEVGRAVSETGADGNFGATEFLSNLFQRGELWDDPQWNPAKDKEQLSVIESTISDLGVAQDSFEAKQLYATTSLHDLTHKRDKFVQDRMDMELVSKGGPLGMLTYMAGTLVDVDAAIGMKAFNSVAKGKRLAKLDSLQKKYGSTITPDEMERLSNTTTRLENMASAGKLAVTSAALVEGGRAAIDPAVDARDVLGAVAASAILGSGLGSLAGSNIGSVADDIINVRVAEEIQKVSPISKEAPYKAPAREMDPNSSLGAAGLKPIDIDIPESSTRIIEDADAAIENNRELLSAIQTFKDFKNPKSGEGAQALQGMASKFYQGLEKIGLESDFDKLFTQGSVGAVLASKLLKSPVGQVVNHRTADDIAGNIAGQANSMWAPNVQHYYNQWRKDNNIPYWSRENFVDGGVKFKREIMKYMTDVRNKRDVSHYPAYVKQAGDDINKANKFILDAHKKHGTEGFDKIEHEDGFFNTVWRSTAFNKIESEIGSARVLEALKNGIRKSVPDMDEDLITVFAQAIKRYARNSELGNPASAMGGVSDDGVLALQRAIEDTGYGAGTGKSSEEMARAALYKDTEKGIASAARRNIPIDLSTPIAGTDKTLMDLVDGDIFSSTERFIRGQSSLAGMSSVGIQKRDIASYIQAVVDEARLSGRSIDEARSAAENAFSMFTESGFRGGVSPTVMRINKLGMLSYLPQLGITQIAEAGVAAGTGGVKAYTKYLGRTIQEQLKGMDHDLLDSFHSIYKFRGDHREFVITNMRDEMSLDEAGKLGRLVDAGLDRGMRTMGHMSGFYKMTYMLQVTAALTMNNYMIKNIVRDTNPARLASMGVDDAFRKVIKKHVDDGSIVFDEAGDVIDIKTGEWDYNELESLQLITRQNMDQTVQKSRRGESYAWMYTDFGALMGSLRGFPLVALNKQVVRNARLADAESAMMLLATTATAALAYTAKQVVNGNADELDTEKIVKGALNWSSLLSPLMMGVDPVAYMVGADKLGMPFPLSGWRYDQNGMIGLPPGLSALNDLSRLGRLPADMIDGDGLSNKSLNALKAVPLIGRSYPMIPVLKALEDD